MKYDKVKLFDKNGSVVASFNVSTKENLTGLFDIPLLISGFNLERPKKLAPKKKEGI